MPSLDEWVEACPHRKFLVENLQANLNALTELNPEEKETLMRCNMIMVRQFAQDSGLR